ncbi:hypothetical protein Asulf_02176 [Archaeoglobus sulfaticallidus PM70-1]|uniref:Response regulatory domain-containing protein n=1 Tax=Archaeoglobus sulfaticallidus PM70-1 TaxID=387631 RepID=N0BER9_9EURY|nr:response regulator [Archaeoglobus sulfaticallidus]AGK62129.1 hypothetical protein Asulf_02176 [Archaeoglobus sulfaticallidus PM70-1]
MKEDEESKAIKILIADDEKALVEIIEKMIVHFFNQYPNFNVVVYKTTSGKEAFQKYAEVKPHLSFIDLVMRDKHGMELIDEITSNFQNSKIIVLSPFSESIIREVKKLGKDTTVLTKPFRIRDLYTAISKVLSTDFPEFSTCFRTDMSL